MIVINGKKIITTFKGFLVISAIIILVLVGKFLLQTFEFPLKYIDVVNKYAAKNSLDSFLVLSVIKTESNFDENAVSAKNAKGLMQITEATATEVMLIDEFNLHNTETNISIGTEYLAMLIKRYDNNIYLAICAYNAGMGNVDKWLDSGIIKTNFSEADGENIPFDETKNYLKRVMYNYRIYQFLY